MGLRHRTIKLTDRIQRSPQSDQLRARGAKAAAARGCPDFHLFSSGENDKVVGSSTDQHDVRVS